MSSSTYCAGVTRCLTLHRGGAETCRARSAPASHSPRQEKMDPRPGTDEPPRKRSQPVALDERVPLPSGACGPQFRGDPPGGTPPPVEAPQSSLPPIARAPMKMTSRRKSRMTRDLDQSKPIERIGLDVAARSATQGPLPAVALCANSADHGNWMPYRPNAWAQSSSGALPTSSVVSGDYPQHFLGAPVSDHHVANHY
jgi:hypothetical protein